MDCFLCMLCLALQFIRLVMIMPVYFGIWLICCLEHILIER